MDKKIMLSFLTESINAIDKAETMEDLEKFLSRDVITFLGCEFVIVKGNGIHYLEACLRALKKQEFDKQSFCWGIIIIEKTKVEAERMLDYLLKVRDSKRFQAKLYMLSQISNLLICLKECQYEKWG